MLTARGDDVDRIVGLEIGADDYLAKPLNPRELAARIKAILRRTQPNAQQNDVLSAGRLRAVQKHSGTISATTAPGGGLRVSIALPLN